MQLSQARSALKGADHLFGRVEVCTHATAIVDEDVGLELADLAEQLFRVPDFCAGKDILAAVAFDLLRLRKMLLEAIKPQDGYVTIVAAQLSHLGMKIVQIPLVMLVAIIRVAPIGLRVVTAKG